MNRITGLILTALLLPILAATPNLAADKPKAEEHLKPGASTTKPTLANVAYGKHPKQVLDFYQATSSQPTPVVFWIHGGGWTDYDKSRIVGIAVPDLLKAGISVVSIDYRLIPDATADGEVPPVRGPMHDAARALQFVRSKAHEWNLDKTRIGVGGGSAGGCSSLWLAFHGDMADPMSDDLIAHESTRPFCAGTFVPQTTLDPQQMIEWTPNSVYGGHAFGFKGSNNTDSPLGAFLAEREKILPWIAEYSPYALVTADDPPVYLIYTTVPALGQNQKDPTHTANFGVPLQEKCRSVGVPCELVYPGAPDVKHQNVEEFLIATLKAPTKGT